MLLLGWLGLWQIRGVYFGGVLEKEVLDPRVMKVRFARKEIIGNIFHLIQYWGFAIRI